ncbi:MAG: acyltransferase [Bacteroidetes bacterium]|nr:acyltransferase [Bacteroidota bacterium]
MYILVQNSFSSNIKPVELEKVQFLYLGNDVKIWPHAKLINTENISIGHRTIIDDFTLIIAMGEPIKIGNFVHISSFCSITGKGGFEMEDLAGLAAGVRISTSDEDYAGGTCLTNPTIFPEFRRTFDKKVIIKKHAIIGTNSVILPGVTIGEGCAVGANSLITKDLEPWSVYIGIPAKKVKERPREIIQKLEIEMFKKYPENFARE